MQFRAHRSRSHHLFALTGLLLALIGSATLAEDRDEGERPGRETTVTAWWILFNHPEACEGPCGSDDFGNPDVGASVLHATGTVVPHNGRFTLVATLYRTDALDTHRLFGPGLVSPETVEVHSLIRWHGPALSGLVTDQSTTPGGGCVENELPPSCLDVMAVVHEGAVPYSVTGVRWSAHEDVLEQYFGSRSRARRLAGRSVRGASSTLIRDEDSITLTVHGRLRR